MRKYLFLLPVALGLVLSAAPTRAAEVCTCPVEPVCVDDSVGSGSDPIATPANLAFVKFNEVLPDPIGTDTDGEFIEIINTGDQAVELGGLSIADDKDRSYTLPSVTLAAGAVRQFSYADSKLPLINGGGYLELVGPGDQTIDQLSYPDSPASGEAYARAQDGNWQWTESPTPGASNIVDADSATGGVTDEQSGDEGDSTGSGTTGDTAPTTYPDADFAITAVFPAPASGSAEWVEITNLGEPASLNGWVIDDAEGGSNPHELDYTELIPTGAKVVLTSDVTKLALNNSGDDVRLYSPSGALVDSMSYGDAKSNEAILLSGGVWSWASDFQADETPSDDEAGQSADDGTSTGASGETTSGEGDILAGIELADDQVLMVGTVTLEPGRFSQTIFSLVDGAGKGYLARIYGENAPALTPGMRIAFPARITDTEEDGPQVSVTGSAMVVLAGGALPTAAPMDIGAITEANHGQMISVSGVVTASGSDWVSLANDALDSEVRVYVPTGTVPNIAESTRLSVTGVVRWQNNAAVMQSVSVDLAADVADDGADDDGANQESGAGEILETQTIELKPQSGEQGVLSSIAISLSGLGATILAIWHKRPL
jgi:hypothetical protein